MQRGEDFERMGRGSKRNSFEIFLRPVFYLSVLTTSLSVTSQGAEVVPFTPSMVPGVGYSPIFESLRGQCGTATEIVNNLSEGLDEEVTISQIESTVELAEQMDISSLTQLKLAEAGAVGSELSAKARFVLESSSSSKDTSVYLLVKAKMTLQSKVYKFAFDPGVLKQFGLDQPDRPVTAEEVNSFLISCGSRHLSRIDRGGEFYALIEIENNSKEEKDKLQAGLDLTIPQGDSSNSLNSSWTEKVRNKRVRIRIHQSGGGKAGHSPTTIEEVLRHVKEYRLKIQEAGAARSISAGFTSYNSLPVKFPKSLREAFKKRSQAKRFLDQERRGLFARQEQIEAIVKTPWNYRKQQGPDHFQDVGFVDTWRLDWVKEEIQRGLNGNLAASEDCFNELKRCPEKPRDVTIDTVDELLQELNLVEDPEKFGLKISIQRKGVVDEHMASSSKIAEWLSESGADCYYVVSAYKEGEMALSQKARRGEMSLYARPGMDIRQTRDNTSKFLDYAIVSSPVFKDCELPDNFKFDTIFKNDLTLALGKGFQAEQVRLAVALVADQRIVASRSHFLQDLMELQSVSNWAVSSLEASLNVSVEVQKSLRRVRWQK